LDVDLDFLKKTVIYSREGNALFLFALLLIINYFIARINGIPLFQWVRGVIPFLFLFFFFVFLRYFETEKDIYRGLTSIIISGLIFVVQEVYIYVSKTLWVPLYYLKIFDPDGVFQWQKVDMNTPGAEPFWERISIFFPKATDVIYLMGFFLLLILFLFMFHRTRRLWSLPFLYGFLFSMIITYSRSFMVCLLAGFFIMTGFLMCRRRGDLAWKTALGLVISLVCVFLTVEILNLTPFKERYRAFYGFIERTARKELKVEEPETKDNPAAESNVIARITEISIAFRKFKESPIFGKGLGIKHDIYYDVGFGKMELFTKAYIHNWVFYFLMTTGVFGTFVYLTAYLMPILRLIKMSNGSRYSLFTTASLVSLFLLSIYGMLFASFRLISFNILHAIFLSIPLSLSLMEKTRRSG
jgi:hypothetical protein